MRAFGSDSKRTHHTCRVYQAGKNRKILFTVGVKNRKLGRKVIGV